MLLPQNGSYRVREAVVPSSLPSPRPNLAKAPVFVGVGLLTSPVFLSLLSRLQVVVELTLKPGSVGFQSHWLVASFLRASALEKP